MSKIRVERLTAELLDEVESKGLLLRAPISYEALRDNLLNYGISICILDDSGVIGCAGIAPIWQGVGEVWSVFDHSLLSRPLTLIRIMKNLLNRLRDSGKFHRVQMTIVETQENLVKWAETLGFTFEGRMVKYGPDKRTHLRYALII